jgi:hypothetical protein
VRVIERLFQGKGTLQNGIQALQGVLEEFDAKER